VLQSDDVRGAARDSLIDEMLSGSATKRLHPEQQLRRGSAGRGLLLNHEWPVHCGRALAANTREWWARSTRSGQTIYMDQLEVFIWSSGNKLLTLSGVQGREAVTEQVLKAYLAKYPRSNQLADSTR
jgi:hypothetical protein